MSTSLDYLSLHRKLERTLNTIRASGQPLAMLESLMHSVLESYGGELGLTGGRIYQREETFYRLVAKVGDCGEADLGFEIPVSYQPIERTLTEGSLVMSAGEPGFDPRIESRLGVTHFAAIALGEQGRYMVAFTLAEPANLERLVYSLATIRHVVDLKLRRTKLEVDFDQARQIQQELLPREIPQLPGYELYAAMCPADVVGGDVYDFIPLADNLLGVTLADVAGHGLPAALQARDIVIGLRMGMERDLKLTRTIEKLNRIIARSSSADKFIALFFGEIETNGNFIYCNAGHTPGLLSAGDKIHELRQGGPVLGPSPHTDYDRGFVQLEPGDVVLLYSDGISEAENLAGEQFGKDRLVGCLRQHHHLPAAELVRRLFEEVERFSRGSLYRDDRTLVVIKRTAGAVCLINKVTPGSGSRNFPEPAGS